MEDLLGIEKTKSFVKWACDLAKEVEDTTSNGWQWMEDAPQFIDDALKVPTLFKSFNEMVKEVKELSDADNQELIAYIAQEFDIKNDEAETLIEDSLALALSLISLVRKWRAIKEAKAARENPPA